MASNQKIIVITGATGTGKTTVSKFLTDQYNIPRIITHTTRPPRPGEVNGTDYYFETNETFSERHLIESVQYANFYYGSSMEALKIAWVQNSVASIVLDTKGAITYLDKLGAQVVLLYLTVESPDLLAQRLKKRGDESKMVAQRLASDEFERDLQLPPALKKAAHVIVNDDFNIAKQQLKVIISGLYLGKN